MSMKSVFALYAIPVRRTRRSRSGIWVLRRRSLVRPLYARRSFVIWGPAPPNADPAMFKTDDWVKVRSYTRRSHAKRTGDVGTMSVWVVFGIHIGPVSRTHNDASSHKKAQKSKEKCPDPEPSRSDSTFEEPQNHGSRYALCSPADGPMALVVQVREVAIGEVVQRQPIRIKRRGPVCAFRI